MSATPVSITHGTLGLELAYALILVALFVGLVRGGAPPRQLFLSPIVAIGLTLVIGIVLAILGPILAFLGVLRALVGAALAVLMSYWAGKWLAAHAEGSTGVRHLRGAVVLALKWVGAMGALRKKGMTLADIAFAPADETKHFKIIGTTGTGKSTAIQELLTAAIERGDRAAGFPR